jgi:hypothetical protein
MLSSVSIQRIKGMNVGDDKNVRTWLCLGHTNTLPTDPMQVQVRVYDESPSSSLSPAAAMWDISHLIYHIASRITIQRDSKNIGFWLEAYEEIAGYFEAQPA